MGLIYGIEKGNIISAFPTFPTLMEYSQVFESKWVKVPLKGHMYDFNAIGREINSETQLVFVCNPNNPTGTYHDKETVAAFCKQYSSQTPIFVDEAYIEFTKDGIGASLAPMVRENRNIMVGRTFSKIYGN